MAAKSGFGGPIKKIFLRPPNKGGPAKNLHTRLERLAVICRVPWELFERIDLYNRQKRHYRQRHKNVAIINQQDATIYSLFIFLNCSTCFGWHFHPSSEAHITVSTVSGIIETVTATCNERDVHDRKQYRSR